MAKRIVVLHSGGMDSTTCLLMAKSEGADVLSLGINYNQRLSIELTYAAEQCRKARIPREVVSVGWQKPERVIPLGRQVEEMGRAISPAFLPGRNVVFVAIASAHAAGLDADEIHIGLNCVEFSGYPDCTPEFVTAASEMLSVAMPGGPILRAPLLNLSKKEIAQEARTLGISKWDTWSCYRPLLSSSGIVPCGACDACILHEHAWEGL